MSVAFKSDAGRAAVHAAYQGLLAAWSVPIEQRTIATSQGETFVVSAGPTSGPPLVLLHGAQANAAAYLFDMPTWAQHFRVHAIDMIGEPGFSAEVRPPLASDAHARWLDDVLAGLGIESALFVGTSLGGWLAVDYATRRPTRVRGLALICPAGIGKQKNFLWRVLPLLLLGPWGTRKARELVLGPAPTSFTPLQHHFGTVMNIVMSHVKLRIVTIPRLTDEELARLPPTLAIIGGKDVLFDSNDTRARLAHHPQATVRLLPDGFHYLPDQTDAVLSFLLSLAA